MLDIFTWPHDGSVSLMSGSYHVGLVALSLLIAVAISCMAMQIVGIARSSGGYHRQLALVTGALALGAGIWSMHFIGMLAFRLCTPVRYDWTITLLSIIPAIIASRVALGRPVQLDGHVLRVQASIGIAFFRPGRHIEAEALLREADEAMYAAKKQGKGGVFVVLDSGRSKVAQPG